MSGKRLPIGFSDETTSPQSNENYSEHYASKYPDEVSSIIMIDTTSSAETSTNVPQFVYRLGKVQQAIGLSRPINSIVVTSTLGINKENGYTQTELSDYTKFMGHYYNDTIADQLMRLNENIEEVMGMDFPGKIPVLKLVSSETAKGKQTGEAYQNAHMERLGASAEWQIIEGNHYLYHGHVADICSATGDFLNNK